MTSFTEFMIKFQEILMLVLKRTPNKAVMSQCWIVLFALAQDQKNECNLAFCYTIFSVYKIHSYWDKHQNLMRLYIQLEAEVFNPHDVFPLIPIVNKSCNMERCVNNMLQIFRNMMVSQCSELELSMFRGTISGQHPLIYVWNQNLQKYSTPWSHWYIIISSSKP